MDIIDKLKLFVLFYQIDFPQLVIYNDQSYGKSSILEIICDI